MQKAATVLWRIYVGMTILLVLLLFAGGASLRDAFSYALTTVSIGGFAPHNASVAAFDSAFVEWTIIAFMLVAGINFSLIFAVRTQPRQLYKDVEFRPTPR